MFISAINPDVQALVGRYSAHATAFTRTILSLPEPPLLYRSPLFSILDFSRLCSHCSVASRHMRRASAGLALTHANGCVALTPFQPTACICISPCTNLIVLQALRERYNTYHGPPVALYLPCPCLYVSLQGSKLYPLVNCIYVIVTLR